MYQEKKFASIYTVSPVHMGSGTSLGVIDNPIQREKHTGHPLFSGSGIKGAAREQAGSGENTMSRDDINAIFGPENNASDHAGAVSFSDAQLVAFPVRSLREGFVYATSRLALSRLARLASMAGADVSVDGLPEPADTQAVVIDSGLLSQGKLVLESYEFANLDEGCSKVLEETSGWLADFALPGDGPYAYFRDKIKRHLVLLSETQFAYFVNNATVVEPHVRIDDTTGTADDGGLFFTENVPPESIFATLVMASQERKKKGDGKAGMSADKVMGKLEKVLHGRLLQIGGDATTGRGQVLVRFFSGDAEQNENSQEG